MKIELCITSTLEPSSGNEDEQVSGGEIRSPLLQCYRYDFPSIYVLQVLTFTYPYTTSVTLVCKGNRYPSCDVSIQIYCNA